MAANPPLVAEIRQGSLDDGPGLRSVVFFKGCPLSCVWCHNPECQSVAPELVIRPSRCLGCGECVAVCSQNLAGPGAQIRDGCLACGVCAEECPADARTLVGRAVCAAELADELVADRAFFANSAGGVTLSGGEATIHLAYLAELARLLQGQEIHVLLETCGHFAWQPFFETLLPHLDQIYVDLKLMDEAEHRRWTGRGNKIILSNISKLLAVSRRRVEVRLPLVPGINDTAHNLTATANWLTSHGCRSIHLLPYNDLWLDKARGLGRSPHPALSKRANPAALKRASALLAQAGIAVL